MLLKWYWVVPLFLEGSEIEAASPVIPPGGSFFCNLSLQGQRKQVCFLVRIGHH